MSVTRGDNAIETIDNKTKYILNGFFIEFREPDLIFKAF